jgi:hypothetical protein
MPPGTPVPADGRGSLPGAVTTAARRRLLRARRWPSTWQHLGDLGLSPATIEQALAAIRTAHRQSGHHGLPDTRAARLVLRAHRRECAEAGDCAVQAASITIDARRAMVDATDPATLAGKRDRVVLVLGLAIMARRSEQCALTFDDITETGDGLEVRVRKSKTDQDARGAVVAVPRGQNPETDLVRLLAAFDRNSPGTASVAVGCSGRSCVAAGRATSSRPMPLATSSAARPFAPGSPIQGGTRPTASALASATVAYRAAGAPVSSIASQGRWAPASPVGLGYIRSVDRWGRESDARRRSVKEPGR